MAYTIEQIQDAINSKTLDARQLINLLADYVQANPGGGVAGYLSYVALLNQVGTNAPIATLIKNDLGGPVTFGYSGQGDFTVNSSGLFTLNKTLVFIQDTQTQLYSRYIPGNANQFSIYTYYQDDASMSFENGVLFNAPFKIEVYP